jgi:hypothetical protein
LTPAKALTLRFYIGGFPGPFYNVESDGALLVYTSSEDGMATERRITPTAQEWAKFGRTLEAADVWRWHPAYRPDSLIVDGTQWSLELADGKRELHSEGDNAEPATFKAFLRALRKLLGGLPLG